MRPNPTGSAKGRSGSGGDQIYNARHSPTPTSEYGTCFKVPFGEKRRESGSTGSWPSHRSGHGADPTRTFHGPGTPGAVKLP
jgi:hypothetical protein